MSKIEVKIHDYTLNDSQISLLAEEFFGATLHGNLDGEIVEIEFESDNYQKRFLSSLDACFKKDLKKS